MKQNKTTQNRTLSRFSIRKCSVGTASFLIGTVAFFGLHHEAFAAENTPTAVTVSQLQEGADKETTQQQSTDVSQSEVATTANTQPTDTVENTTADTTNIETATNTNDVESSTTTGSSTDTTNQPTSNNTVSEKETTLNSPSSTQNNAEQSETSNQVVSNDTIDSNSVRLNGQQDTAPSQETQSSQTASSSQQDTTSTIPSTQTSNPTLSNTNDSTNTAVATQTATNQSPTASSPQTVASTNTQNVNTLSAPASPSTLKDIQGTTQLRAASANTVQPTAAGGTNVNDKVTATDMNISESYIEPNNSGSFYLRSRFNVTGQVKGGDYFTVEMPKTVNIYGDTRFHPENQEILKNANGEVIAIGDYDVASHSLKFTFTDVVNGLTNVNGSFNLTQFMDRKEAPDSQIYPLSYKIAGETLDTKIEVHYGQYYNVNDSNLKSMITMEDSKTGDYEQYIYVNPLKKSAYGTVVRVKGYQNDAAASNGQLNPENSKIQIFKVGSNQNLNSSFGVNDSEYVDVTDQFKITYPSKDVADIYFGNLYGARYIVKVTSKEVPGSTADLNLRSTMFTENIYGQYDAITWDNNIVKSESSGSADGTEASYQLGDKVWEDLNKDGHQDENEPGIPDVTVILKDRDGNVIDTALTNANGKYIFDHLKNGTYYVDFETPENYTPTVSNQGNDALDSDGPKGAVAIISGGNNLTVDQGFYLIETPKYNVGDKVWHDLNKNGIQDTNEPGISNVTVTLKDASGNVIGTRVTDTNGNYLFENIEEGEYQIDFETPEGFTPTLTDQGTLDQDSNGASSRILISGQDDLTIDSGFYRPTFTIGDKVWEDTNKDGVQDADEKGIAGVTVTLTRPDGSTSTTTTDANGEYRFTDLPNGDYKVTFQTPEGFESTVANAGSDDAADSDGTSVDVSVNNADDLTIDSGFYRPTFTIGDKVWEDTNKDGVQDADEKGIAGVTVTLTRPDGSTSTTTTDANGEYRFTDLPNGDYKVTFQTPEGFESTVANAGADDAADSDGTSVDVSVNNADDLTIDSGFYQHVPTPPTPDQPEEPEQPTPPTPDQPEEPEQPTPPTPDQPEEPGQPTPPTPDQPEEPEQPTPPTPDQPEEPEQPTPPTPDQPEEPEQPTPPTPDQPEEPGQPAPPAPEQPNVPNAPNAPMTPSVQSPSTPGLTQVSQPVDAKTKQPTKTDDASKLPETGQSTSQQTPLLGGLIAAFGALLFARKKRKDKKQSH